MDDGFASGHISETAEKEELISGNMNASHACKEIVITRKDGNGSSAVPLSFLGP